MNDLFKINDFNFLKGRMGGTKELHFPLHHSAAADFATDNDDGNDNAFVSISEA
jgi:hypothetical protein